MILVMMTVEVVETTKIAEMQMTLGASGKDRRIGGDKEAQAGAPAVVVHHHRREAHLRNKGVGQKANGDRAADQPNERRELRSPPITILQSVLRRQERWM